MNKVHERDIRPVAWKLAKRFLGIDGGSIHQLAGQVNCETGLLLGEYGDACQVALFGLDKKRVWHDAIFISLDGFPLNSDGKRWAKFTAFVPGFNGPNNCSGLRGGHNIRMQISNLL